MTSETLEELTIELPARLVRTIQSRAASNQTTPSRVVADVLRSTLVPDGAEIDRAVDELLREVAKLPPGELRKAAEAHLPDGDQDRLAELQAENGERTLTAAEAAELDTLLERVRSIAERSVAARWILNQTRRSRKRVS